MSTVMQRFRLLGLLALLFVPARSWADPPRPPKAEGGAAVSGVVAAVSGNIVTIMNGQLAIDVSDARFESREGSVSIVDLKPGARIHATVADDTPPGATLQATRVVILDVPDGTLAGTLDTVNVSAGTVTLLGATVQVTAETRISMGRDQTPKTIADLKAGDRVLIEVQSTGTGLVAEQIRILPPLPNASVEGVVKSMAPGAWIVTSRSDGTDVTVIITAETRIEGSPQVGDTVHVVGISDTPGTIVALAIFAADAKRQDSFEGVVKSIGSESWVITARDGNDVTVLVNADTRLEGSPKVGDTVRVIGHRDEAGNFVATAIVAAHKRRKS